MDSKLMHMTIKCVPTLNSSSELHIDISLVIVYSACLSLTDSLAVLSSSATRYVSIKFGISGKCHTPPIQKCSCSNACRNRVAQRPRDVPLQIFRTSDNGWGVRATIDLERGKIVGVYTGSVFSAPFVPKS